MAKTVTAVIAAAGSSQRMGFDKLAFDLGGHTVLEQSVLAFDACAAVNEIVLVAGEGTRAEAQKAAALCHKPVKLAAGGATRAESVKAGVLAASGEIVAIHDAARPFVSQALLCRVIAAAKSCGAAAPAVPVKDTIKAATRGDGKTVPEGCKVQATPDRSTLYAVQTPQCFAREQYLAALQTLDAAAAAQLTDDCSLLEQAGYPVALVQGEYANLKITTREDLPAPQKEKTMLHIGHGYDVHQLAEGRRLILGGVDIPYEKGLLGHSDADVLTHAVMDAALGGAALGDIGQHFPDTDPAFAGADSLALARQVANILQQNGWKLVNIDATLLCQAPKLAPHIPAMRENLARAFGMAAADVSVKATTEEHLGFTGAGLGIAAHAVALLEAL
ncbi:MAG: 2-C-methyl-D-erythritol 2,4-cyclodiphosphate synthase [Faecalibacterium sp.]|nr:2-C-methyl-D-erythritol 2,4-cyclodiphosphate synthase [Faecalibacterium sp.]